MSRISSNQSNNDMQYSMMVRQNQLNELQNKMANQTRIHNLRDDPVAAAHSTRFKSLMNRYNRFSENVETIQGRLQMADGHLQHINNIVLRVRDLAVQGANGTFTQSDTKAMGEEVNQLLNELVEVANSTSGDGMALFGGDRVTEQPFLVLEGKVEGGNGRMITDVKYNGSFKGMESEIAERTYMESNIPGNEVFWAENQQVFASSDATGYIVQEDSSIFIDGEQIDLKSGDNVQTLIAKINDSPAMVKASLDPVLNSLIVESTTPHQLMIEDGAGGSVLKDLGILSDIGRPPRNLADDARVSGGSLFDMVINLRDKLYSGDTADIGSGALKGIDLAHSNLVSRLGEIGARDERLQLVGKRLTNDIPQLLSSDSRLVDLDMAEAITELKMLEYSHKAALQTAARVIQPTLLDFLR